MYKITPVDAEKTQLPVDRVYDIQAVKTVSDIGEKQVQIVDDYSRERLTIKQLSDQKQEYLRLISEIDVKLAEITKISSK